MSDPTLQEMIDELLDWASNDEDVDFIDRLTNEEVVKVYNRLMKTGRKS